MTVAMFEAVVTMTTIEDAFDYVNLPGDIVDPYSAKGSLLAVLGANAEDPLDELGFLDEATFNEALANWWVGGNEAEEGWPASPLLKGKSGDNSESGCSEGRGPAEDEGDASAFDATAAGFKHGCLHLVASTSGFPGRGVEEEG